jgi:hypothetical protein
MNVGARGLPVAVLLAALVLTWATAATGAVVQPPGFVPAHGWWLLTNGPGDDRQLAPDAPATWAASDPAGVQPDLFSMFLGLRGLSARGIVIWAITAGRGGPTTTFTRAGWPLRLRDFRVDHGWEGQPAANVQQRLRWAAVGGWHLDVRVYFGTEHPDAALLARAQAELDRLRLPPR